MGRIEQALAAVRTRPADPRGQSDAASLAERVAAHDWYHTLELAPGVVTPGWFDTRPLVRRLPLPDRLDGQRALDVGTFDGFWAFELERRGAAEVVAIDVPDPSGWDWPAGSEEATRAALARRVAAGAGFELARERYGSAVVRRERSVYDLDPARDGSFDFVYLGSVLLHLRDPVGALERVRSVCRGSLLLVDAVDLGLAVLHRRPVAALDGRGRPWWWKPNPRGLARMVEAAGFACVAGPRIVFVRPGRGGPRRALRPALRPAALRSAAGREALRLALLGDPHAAILARPA